MYPLRLEIKEIQYDISAKCNQITLYTYNNQKILEFCDYDNFVDLEILKQILNPK